MSWKAFWQIRISPV